MQTGTKSILGAALAGWTLFAGGCDYTPQHQVPTAQPAQETLKAFGDYEIHYNALRTDQLTQDVARSYGIQRSANRVMLTVTVLQRQRAGTAGRPVEAAVKADAYNLNGQVKNLELRRVSEGDAIYYIGDVSIGGTEILVFDIAVTPSGEQSPFTLKFQREFHST